MESCPYCPWANRVRMQTDPEPSLSSAGVWRASSPSGKGSSRLSVLSHIQLFATQWTGSPLGSSVHGIFQARILEWVAISFSRGSS